MVRILAGLPVLQAGRSPDALLLKRGAMFVTRILRIFGVVTQARSPATAAPQAQQDPAVTARSHSGSCPSVGLCRSRICYDCD